MNRRYHYLKNSPVGSIVKHFLRNANRQPYQGIPGKYRWIILGTEKFGITTIETKIDKRPRYTEMESWINDRTTPSDWHIMGLYLFFRDPNVAFEFKMRWV